MDTVMLLLELIVITFFLEPMMHQNVNLITRGGFILLFILIHTPFFFFCEWCLVFHYNEVVRIFAKSENFQTLLSKTGHPLLVFKEDNPGEVLLKNEKVG